MCECGHYYVGPFKYDRSGHFFSFNGKTFRTKAYYEYQRKYGLADAIYDDDELYARHIRFDANTSNRNHPFEIFDELPEGWRLGVDDGRFGWGLRGNWDRDSKYLWCESGPMYRNAYPGDSRVNPNYRQALVKRF